MNSPGSLLFLTVNDGPWTINIHGPHVPAGHKHVHITCRKLRGKYSWNVSGSRHDQHEFPENDKLIIRAKKLASEHLRISVDILQLITMEHITQAPGLLEIQSSTQSILILTEQEKARLLVIFGSDKGQLHIIVTEE